MRLRLLAAAALAAAALPGCGGDVPRSRVHGTIKFQGKPLTGATIILIASDNKTHPALLQADGSYALDGVARGPVKVSIQQDLPRVASKSEKSPAEPKGGEEKDARRAAAPPPAAKDAGPRVPDVYTDPEKSGLTFDLKDPDQEWSVDLK